MNSSNVRDWLNWTLPELTRYLHSGTTPPNNKGINQEGTAPASAATVPTPPAPLQPFSRDGFSSDISQLGTGSSTLPGVPPPNENHPSRDYIPIPIGPNSNEESHIFGPPSVNALDPQTSPLPYRWPTPTGMQVGLKSHIPQVHPLTHWNLNVPPAININSGRLQLQQQHDHLIPEPPLVRDVPHPQGNLHLERRQYHHHQQQQRLRHYGHYDHHSHTLYPTQTQTQSVASSSSAPPPANENCYQDYTDYHHLPPPLPPQYLPQESGYAHHRFINVGSSLINTSQAQAQAQAESSFPTAQNAFTYFNALGDGMGQVDSTTQAPQVSFNGLNGVDDLNDLNDLNCLNQLNDLDGADGMDYTQLDFTGFNDYLATLSPSEVQAEAQAQVQALGPGPGPGPDQAQGPVQGPDQAQAQEPGPEQDGSAYLTWEPLASIYVDPSNIAGPSSVPFATHTPPTAPPTEPPTHSASASTTAHDHDGAYEENEEDKLPILCLYELKECKPEFRGLQAFEEHLKTPRELGGHGLPTSKSKPKVDGDVKMGEEGKGEQEEEKAKATKGKTKATSKARASGSSTRHKKDHDHDHEQEKELRPAKYACQWPGCHEERTASSIVNHVLTHTGVTMKCPKAGCDKWCTRLDSVRKHVRETHEEIWKGLRRGGVRLLKMKTRRRWRDGGVCEGGKGKGKGKGKTVARGEDGDGLEPVLLEEAYDQPRRRPRDKSNRGAPY